MHKENYHIVTITKYIFFSVPKNNFRFSSNSMCKCFKKKYKNAFNECKNYLQKFE